MEKYKRINCKNRASVVNAQNLFPALFKTFDKQTVHKHKLHDH